MTRAPRTAGSSRLRRIGQRASQQQPAPDPGIGSASLKRLWRRLEKTVAVLASIGALILVGFTWKSITQVNSSQAIDREGHITDRYMAAVELLGNRDSEEVRLGGLYGLQRVMQDSPRDQPTVINVVTTFIRAHSPKPKSTLKLGELPSDITAALAVLRTRDDRHDGNARVNLHDSDLKSANLRGAVLTRADLGGAYLRRADLGDAYLRGADLGDAYLGGADLSGAHLGGADLSGAHLNGADLSRAKLGGANLRYADLDAADLARADLAGADLAAATLVCADLRGAVLLGAVILKDQLMSAGLSTGLALPAYLADDPELKKRAASKTKPDRCT
ncbi:pentapeptide repeat-containing protein [Streptomyces spororaveus]|uniref:pentapeptide repeat-containing protein n=1 Tax=Streptomyces spororaveus TaxID=284039 RepID=UPI0037B715D4